MNTTVAVWIGGIILAMFAADFLFFGSELWVFSMKRLLALMHWLAVWR